VGYVTCIPETTKTVVGEIQALVPALVKVDVVVTKVAVLVVLLIMDPFIVQPERSYVTPLATPVLKSQISPEVKFDGFPPPTIFTQFVRV
jgi:hypothetical protein